MDAYPSHPDRRDIVTASDLVRSFGLWGERALQRPVYVLHRGRPRLMLASIELIDRLCRPLEESAGDGDRLTALLDAAPGLIAIVGRDLAIVAASRQVRAVCGGDASPVARLVDPAHQDALTQAIRRVTGTARAEAIEVTLAGNPTRHVTLAIEPHPDGAALFGREGGRPANDDRSSLDETFAISRGAAVARLDRYGFLDGPHTALAALTGMGVSMLSSLRFVSLCSIESRGAIADLIAAVQADGESRSGPARLLVADGDSRAVTVALAPRRRGTEIDGVVALILATN